MHPRDRDRQPQRDLPIAPENKGLRPLILLFLQDNRAHRVLPRVVVHRHTRIVDMQDHPASPCTHCSYSSCLFSFTITAIAQPPKQKGQPLRGQPVVVPRPPYERGGVWSVYLHPLPVATTPEADGAKIVVARIYGFKWNRCLSPRAFVNSAVVESISVIEGVTEVPAAPGTTSNSGFKVSG